MGVPRPISLAAHQAHSPAGQHTPAGGSLSVSPAASCGAIRHGGWKSTISLAAAVAEFNANNPVGTPGFLLRDAGQSVPTKVAGHARLLGGDKPVAIFDGIHGFFSIERFVKTELK